MIPWANIIMAILQEQNSLARVAEPELGIAGSCLSLHATGSRPGLRLCDPEDSTPCGYESSSSAYTTVMSFHFYFCFSSLFLSSIFFHFLGKCLWVLFSSAKQPQSLSTPEDFKKGMALPRCQRQLHLRVWPLGAAWPHWNPSSVTPGKRLTLLLSAE